MYIMPVGCKYYLSFKDFSNCQICMQIAWIIAAWRKWKEKQRTANDSSIRNFNISTSMIVSLFFFRASNRPLTSKLLEMFAHFSVFRSPIAMKWHFKSIFLRLHWCYWQLIAHWNIIAINVSNEILIQTISFIWNSFSECNIKTSKQLCSWYKNRSIIVCCWRRKKSFWKKRAKFFF